MRANRTLSFRKDKNMLKKALLPLLFVLCVSFVHGRTAAYVDIVNETVMAITTCPTVITQPGHYRLANDLFCSGTDGIVIRADHVTLMLDEHNITQDVVNFGLAGNGISAGVGIVGGNSHVRIFGTGVISGFGE